MNRTLDPRLRQVAFEQKTVSTSAVSFTEATVAGAVEAWVKVSDQPVRLRVDGTSPTAAIGLEFLAGGEFVLRGEELKTAEFIRTGGTDATVAAIFYR